MMECGKHPLGVNESTPARDVVGAAVTFKPHTLRQGWENTASTSHIYRDFPGEIADMAPTCYKTAIS